MQRYDIAIIGGGLVGSALARAIAGSGYSVAIIDKARSQELYAAELDNRGLALTYITQQYLEKLGVWKLLADDAYPIECVHVSQVGSFGFTKLNKNHNMPVLGYVVSASKLGFALINDLDSLSSLTVLRPETIKSAHFDQKHSFWVLQLLHSTVRASLVIACDGTDSFMRKVSGIGLITKDFRQTAIVTNVSINGTKKIAYERFCDKGVIAMLPFGQDQIKSVWTADNIDSNQLLQLADEEYLELLQHYMGFRLGVFSKLSKRISYPISMAYIDSICAQNLLFLGNAANTLHPVAAQGFNLGIRDVILLNSILVNARSNKSLCYEKIINNYIAKRRLDHVQTRNFCNGLVELFALGQPFATMRAMGLFAIQFMPTLKNKIMHRGIGAWM